ncbi:MAG: hypothetical protein Kow0088_16150 [Anaerolineales bacterium]
MLLTLSTQEIEKSLELLPGWLVLGFTVVAILFGLIILFLNRSIPLSLRWINRLFLVISIIGLGVAVYIAYVQLLRVQAICGPLENCNTVLQSRYAKLLGFVPNSVLGILSYLVIFFLWAWHQRHRDWLGIQAPLLIVAITLLGSLLSVYLTTLQIFVLKALCIWCLSSATLISGLFLVSISLYQTIHLPASTVAESS